MKIFEERKQKYLNELKDILFTERIGINEYTEELGEDDFDKILSPETDIELDLAESALNLFTKLRSVSKSYEFDPNNNILYIYRYLIYKAVRNPQYAEYAFEFISKIKSNEYLKGKFIVDSLVVPHDAFNSVAEYELEKLDGDIMLFLGGSLILSDFIMEEAECKAKAGNMYDEEIEEGIPTYLHKNNCVLTYLKEMDTHTEEDEYVRTFRKEHGI